MIDCDAVMREFWEFLDGELSAERIARLEAHVGLCDRCRPHAAIGRSFKRALRSARTQTTAPAELALRVRESLRAQGLQDPR